MKFIKGFVAGFLTAAMMAATAWFRLYNGNAEASTAERQSAWQIAVGAVRDAANSGCDVDGISAEVERRLSPCLEIDEGRKVAIRKFCAEAKPLMAEWRQADEEFASMFKEMIDNRFVVTGAAYSVKSGEETELEFDAKVLIGRLYGRNPFNPMFSITMEEGIMTIRDRYLDGMEELVAGLSIALGDSDGDSLRKAIRQELQADVKRIDETSSFVKLIGRLTP